ncbi:FHA domain-containing protein, partial [Streptomyces sp. NPDC003077]|uniref:FHA domain-containing protein n=1 Tax=Streptomyces sp. NPDC003077 TaxID=3154443 RepID=UPI0033ADE585
MQIRLTVLGPRSGPTTRACDVLVTAPAGTALAAVAGGLAAAVAGPGAEVGGGPVVLYAGTERLDLQRAAIGEPPLIDGAVLALHAPGPAPAHGLPHGPARLRVVSGPDAGGVHLLHGGQIRIGRSADADVPLDDPDVSRLHCAVTLEPDGSVLVADLRSTNGTTVDGADVGERPAPLPPGALLHIGESVLRLQPSPGAPEPTLPVTPDGEGHLRVAVGAEGAGAASGVAGPAGASRASGAPSGGPDFGAAPVRDESGTSSGFGTSSGAAAREGRRGHAGATAGVPTPARGTAHGWGVARAPEAPRATGRPGPSGAPGNTPPVGDASVPGMRSAPHDAPDAAPARPRATVPPDPRHASHPPSAGTGPGAPGHPSPYGETGAAPAAFAALGAAGASVGAPLDRPATTRRNDTPVRGTSTSYGTAHLDPYGPPHPHAAAGAPVAHPYDGEDPTRPRSDAPYEPRPTTSGLGTMAPGAPDGDRTHAGQQRLDPEDMAPRKGGRRGGLGAWARRLTGGRAAADRPAHVPAPSAAPEDAWATGPVPHDAAPSGPAAHDRLPDAATLLLTALGPGPRLWERGPEHPDALTLRLGTAVRDGGRAAVPVSVALRTAGSLGLAGPRARLTGLARAAVAQLAALHSPGTVELVLISADRSRSLEERLEDWSWLGWLPHTRPGHGQDCRLLLAYDKEQAAARLTELTRRLDDGPLGAQWAAADPAAVADAARRHTGPHTVVLLDGDPGSAALRETAARLATAGHAAGVHLICLAETPASSPAFPLAATYEAARAASPALGECGAVAVLSGDVATALRIVRPGTDPNGTVATVDAVSGAWAERFARALAPLRETESGPAGGGRPARGRSAPLPEKSRLLDELGLARATPASLLARWAAAADDPRSGATAVLGAGPRGPLTADFAADGGSHLLMEGAAATGKTELLRSLAASLAAADRPDLLSLVLIDGGGIERGEGLKVCTDLPHVTTYLAASDPLRMRAVAQELTSELKRRAEMPAGTDFADWRAAPPGGAGDLD